MTDVATTPAAATPTATRRRKAAASFDANPAKAGWLTKLVLAVICVLWMVPLLGTFVTSFRTLDDVNSSGWWTVFTHPSGLGALTLDNYDKALTGNANMGRAFVNSLAIALPATFIPILIAAFAAYAFTFMEFKGRDVLFLTIVSLLVVPNYVAFVPILKLYRELGLNGTFPAVWLAHIGFGMSLAIYILRNYMATLPKTVIESAKIDGASHYQTFFRLVLPMSVPALASFAIFQFLWVWNDLLVALVFIGPGDNEPVTVGLTHLKTQLGQGWELTTAGGFITMILPILVFLALQRFFVRGLTAGAVKG
ncbi:MAG: sugar transporter permease [Nocardioides sp.]|nr:sugar transporter permease [Nocardioides sp.]